MYFANLINHLGLSKKYSVTALRLAAVLILLCGIDLVSSYGQAVEISAKPYPVGNITVTREDLTSQTYRFNFKNLSVTAGENMRSRNQTWMLAGSRGIVPKMTVESANFVLIQDGKESPTAEKVPPQVTQGLVRFDDIGLLRQYWAFTMSLKTSSPSGNGGYWILKDASVVVDIGAAPAQEPINKSGRFNGKFGEERLPGGLLLNPDINPRYYISDYSDPVDAWKSWTEKISAAAAGGNLFKFSIYAGGFYRLSTQDLAQTTSTPLTVPASQWRVYRNGEEVALFADPLDPAKAVYLPVGKSPADNLQESVYWIDASGKGKNENQPLRLSAQAEPAASSAQSVGTSITKAGTINVTHREFTNYNPKLKPGPGSDRWYWTDLTSDAPSTLEIVMPDYYAPTSGSIVRTIVTYGFSNFPPIQPELVMHIGTHDTQRVKLASQLGTAILEVPASSLKPGKNELALRLDYPFEAVTKRPVVVQQIDTQWDQPLAAPTRDGYFFQSVNGASTSGTAFQFSESLPANVTLFAFNEDKPSLLPAKGNTVRASQEGYREYLVANTDYASTVSTIQNIKKLYNLADINSAQSVIIAAPELVEQAKSLVEMHKTRGLNAVLYSVRDLYNVFSYGNADPDGIRKALRYMFFQAEGQPPEYVTLIGEASDFRGDPRLAPPGVQLDMVPASAANSPESPQGDEKYAASIGSDLIADFIVGRIPAMDAEQLRGYLEKAEAFQSGPDGEWSRTAEFVMDDNDEFPDVVERVETAAMSPVVNTRLFRQWDYQYVPNLRVQGKKRSWAATRALVKSFNEGLGILNFFGHGGPNLWSHERLLHLSDLEHISNGTRLPLITCASCDNAWITYPMPPVKASMGEQMVLKPDGGAIGLFGPVSGASPYEHATLVQSLLEGVLRVQLRRTGDATYYAKNVYYGVTRSASIPEQYLLLGDPTVSLRMPVVEPLLTMATEDLRAGGGAHVSVGLDRSVTMPSTGTLVLINADDNTELVSVEVKPRQTRWDVPLPAQYTGGCVMAVLEFRDNGKTRLVGTSFGVLPPMEQQTGTYMMQIGKIGNAYEISSVSTPADAVTRTNPVYGFKIKSTDGSAGVVRVQALRDGAKVGEASKVTLTTGTAATDFQITGKLADEAAAGNISLVVYPEGKTASGDAVTTITYSVPPLPSAELEFVPGTARVYSDSGDLVSGVTVMFEAELRNTGARPAEKISLQALRDDPSTGSELVTINEATAEKIERILPGESKKVTFRWENSMKGSYSNFYLVVNRNKVVPEGNTENNSILLPPFEVLAMGNFFISDFNVTPRYVSPGTPVSVTAVLRNDHLRNRFPVAIEIGWERPFDKETTAVTTVHTRMENGVTTISRQIEAVEGFTHLFVNLNSDLEIEESNPGDNTTYTQSMIVYDVPSFEKSQNLANTFSWGAKYNLDMPYNDKLQVGVDFTSTTDYLVLEQSNVVTGRATLTNNPSDQAWYVSPWQVIVGNEENPGGIGFRLPLNTLAHDVPGRLLAYLIPYPGNNVPVQVMTDIYEGWRTPDIIGDKGYRVCLDFGMINSRNGAIAWSMNKAAQEGFHMEYLYFRPYAVQWDSPPYHLDESLRTQNLKFAMDTDESLWQSVYIDCRAGTPGEGGSIVWQPWQTTEGKWQANVSGAEYLQFRVIGVPKEKEYPFLENFRITR